MEWNWIQKMKAVMRNVLEKRMLEQGVGARLAVSDKMGSAIALWDKLYRNQAPWLEQGGGLNLASAIAGELARLATIELQSQVTGKGRGEWLDAAYRQVLPQLRRQAEYGCAKGGLVLKPYVEGRGIQVDFVQNDCFFPTDFNSAGAITGAIFADRRQVGGVWYTKLEYQRLQAEGLLIENTAYRSPVQGQLGSRVSLSAVADWAALAPRAMLANVEGPLFAYFKVPQANTVDPASPLGASVYARAVDLLQDADRQYARLLWEYEAGEMALDADETLFRRDNRGNLQLPQGRERLFRVLTGIDEDSQKLRAWAPSLRDEALLRGLNEILKRIEDVCGLARGSFSAPDNQAKTATELKILKQRSYATIKDLQRAMEDALRGLVGAMDVLATVYDLAPAGEYQVAFRWDDSVVVDAESQRKQDLLEVEQGILLPWEYRVKWYGEPPAEAQKRVGSVGNGGAE